MIEPLDRRIVPRLEVTSEQFRLSSNGKIFSVVDLSMKGMGIRVIEPDDLFLFPVGKSFSGVLNLRHVKYQISAKVTRVAREQIGCEFENLSDSVSALLNDALDPKWIGSQLKPMPQLDQTGTPYWYHGPSSTEVLIWRELDGSVSRLFAVVLGQYVSWSEPDGLETGWVASSGQANRRNGLVFQESLDLRKSETADRHAIELVRQLIQSSSINDPMRTKLIRELSPEKAKK